MTIKPITFTRRGRTCRNCGKAFGFGDKAMRYKHTYRRGQSGKTWDSCIECYNKFMGGGVPPSST